MHELKKVCIVIFTCDRPDDLKRCLDSVSRQAFKDFEVIIVNNGDDAETNDILKSHDARIIKDRTKRLSYLFNLGWKNSGEELIVYLADDVELTPGWLGEAVSSLNRHNDAAVVTGPLISPFEFTGEMHALHTKAGKGRFLRIAAKFYDDFILEGKTFEPCVLCESGSYTLGQGFKPNFTEEREVGLATTSAMLIRRSAIEAVGGFDENFIFNHADGDLFIRIRKKGYRVIYNPNMLAMHYNRLGPSRNPYYIGRDTAYFYLKDIRPKSLRGTLAAFTNVLILNGYWIYKTISAKDIKQMNGMIGFLKGSFDYLYSGFKK